MIVFSRESLNRLSSNFFSVDKIRCLFEWVKARAGISVCVLRFRCVLAVLRKRGAVQKYTCIFLRENEIFFDRQKKDSYLLKIVYLFDIVRVHRTRSLTREKLSNFMQIYLHTSIATAQNKNSSTQTFFICFTHPVLFFDNSFTRKISRACRKIDFSANNAYFYSNIVNLLRITVPSL